MKRNRLKQHEKQSTKQRHSTRSKYRPDYHPELLYRAALLGMTVDEMAKLLDVKKITLEQWLIKKPEVKEAVRKGRVHADTDVAMSMYKQATGQVRILDNHVAVIKGEVVVTPLVKQLPPSTAAGIFWLKNRTRNLTNPWCEISKHEIETKQVNTLNIEDIENLDTTILTTEELQLVHDLTQKAQKKKMAKEAKTLENKEDE